MKIKGIFCLLVFAWQSLGLLTAQEELIIGQWKSFLPYTNAKHVSQSEENVYFAANKALLVVKKSDFSVQYISKIEGLSQLDIALLKYVPETKDLFILYENGVIDIVPERGNVSTWYYIQDFQTVGGKEFFDLDIVNRNQIAISSNLGVSIFDLEENIISFSTFTNNLNVNNFLAFQDNYYMATPQGVYKVNTNNAFVEDFNQWQHLGPAFGLDTIYNVKAIEVFNNQLFIGIDSTVYVLDEDTIRSIDITSPLPIQYLTAERERLIVGYADTNIGSNAESGIMHIVSDDLTYFEVTNQCNPRPIYAIEDEKGFIWCADHYKGFNRIVEGNCSSIATNTPYSVRNKKLLVNNNDLYITSGGYSINLSPLTRKDGFSVYKGENWKSYNQFNRPELFGLDDMTPIVYQKSTDLIWIGSYYDGLISFDGENFVIYDDSNSSMTNTLGDISRTRVSGLAIDSNGELWVVNNSGSRPLSIRKSNGTWQNFDVCGDPNFFDLTIDDFNNKWIVSGSNSAGFVIFNETTQMCKTYTSGNSNLPSNNVNAITQDLNGEMWVGTDQGIVIFDCAGIEFQSNCTGLRPIVQVEDVNAQLLKDENVKCIAIDGGNRKWVGTNNGVFILSPNGKEQINYLNENNSLLFDNEITDITINGKTGWVYIGTAKGVQAIRAEATEGNTRHTQSPVVFPNPVRPDYNGLIAINGLAQNAEVKITDSNGKLVYQTTSIGGQAVWDGRDYNGRRATTGVYWVFSARTSNLAEKDSAVAKILFIN